MTLGRERLKASLESWFTAHGPRPQEAASCQPREQNYGLPHAHVLAKKTGLMNNARNDLRLSHCVMSKYFSFGAEWINWKIDASEILYSPTIRNVYRDTRRRETLSQSQNQET